MTKAEVIKLLVQIEAVYSYCMTRDETVTNWFRYCQLMDFEKVVKKLHLHMRKSPYPPSITDLAVFKEGDSYILEAWIAKGKNRIEPDLSRGQGNDIPAWMNEYSPKLKTGEG